MKYITTGLMVIMVLATLTACSKSIADRGDDNPTTDNSLPLEDTRWVLNTINGTAVLSTDREVTSIFIAGEVSGFAGCNSYHGGYTLEDGNLSVTGPIVSTMMACAESE